MSSNPFAAAERAAFSSGPIGTIADWVRAHRLGLLVAAGVFQVGILLSMAAIHAAPLVVGETILLRTEPVDPRDFFRGDYVILSYPIGQVPPEGIEGLPEAYNGWWRYDRQEWLDDRTVYVSLEPEPDGKYHRAVKASIDRPATGKFIKGRYGYGRFGRMGIRFGIEAFYLTEKTGVVFEQAQRHRALSAEVALAPWGQATLRRLVIDPHSSAVDAGDAPRSPAEAPPAKPATKPDAATAKPERAAKPAAKPATRPAAKSDAA